MSKKCPPPTKVETEHLLAVKALGCYVGIHFPEERQYCSGYAEAHHITDYGRRISHRHTIGLCFNHHHAQTPLATGCSVHKGKRMFERMFGTQEDMLKWTWDKLGYSNDV